MDIANESKVRQTKFGGEMVGKPAIFFIFRILNTKA
jgi:hypothetical protein